MKTNYQPEGNYYDKYHSTNPIVKWMMSNFFSDFKELLQQTGDVNTILEAGCGEGEISAFLWKYYGNACKIKAFDISEKVIGKAKKDNKEIDFSIENIYELDASGGYELVVCSEVLEHLEFPEKALEKLIKATNKYLILSVPREPIWRMLNILRGKYWKNLGNTPGHIQHWGSRSFIRFIKKSKMKIIQVKKPYPWTLVLLGKEG